MIVLVRVRMSLCATTCVDFPCCTCSDKALPDLFNFSRAEVKHMGRKYAPLLIPKHVKLPFDVEAILDGRDPKSDEDVYVGYNDKE